MISLMYINEVDKLNLGIVFGGKSVEHDISIISYFQVLNSIDIKKYNIYPFYLNKNNYLC